MMDLQAGLICGIGERRSRHEPETIPNNIDRPRPIGGPSVLMPRRHTQSRLLAFSVRTYYHGYLLTRAL